MKIIEDLITLGQSELKVSPIGVGTNGWGYNNKANPELRHVFDAALNVGINFFDSAEVYHSGGSEKTIGLFLTESGQKPVVTSKFFPYPVRVKKSQFKDALLASLERLQLTRLDLYLIHFPWPPVPIETWVEALAEAQESGLVRAVGVSNYNVEQMRLAHKILSAYHIPLACNQVEFNLYKKGPEKSGLLAACKQLGVTLVAYRPLASGTLSGKFNPNDPASKQAVKSNSGGDPRHNQPLGQLLHQIGVNHGGKTPSQVALNWVLSKGALPIPGVTRVEHINENMGALGWHLQEDEVLAMDQADLS